MKAMDRSCDSRKSGGSIKRSRITGRWEHIPFAFAALLVVVLIGSTNARAEKVFTFSVGLNVTRLDPHTATSATEGWAANLAAETLLRLDFDGKIIPWLATSWKSSDDGLTRTFNLRKGVRFQDGTPFNAAAVKFNFDRLRDKKTRSRYRGFYTMIESVEVVDDSTVRFRLIYPYAPLLSNFTFYASAQVSPAAVKKHGKSFFKNPVGTGPFKHVKSNPGVRHEWVRNDGYWGKKPKIDRLIEVVIRESAGQAAALKAGDIQMAAPINPALQKTLEADQNIKLSFKRWSYWHRHVSFNTSKKPFNDVRVRKAVYMAINRDAIFKRIYKGFGARFDGPLGPKVFGYDPTAKGPDYDPEAAKKLLAEAGFPNGFQTELWTVSFTTFKTVSEAIQADLAKVGIQAQVKALKFGGFISSLKRGQPPMWYKGWPALNGDADQIIFQKFHSSTIGSQNYARYKNEEMDRLIDAQRKEQDTEKRKAIISKVVRKVIDEYLWVPIVNDGQLGAVRKNISGFRQHPTDDYSSFVDIDIK